MLDAVAFYRNRWRRRSGVVECLAETHRATETHRFASLWTLLSKGQHPNDGCVRNDCPQITCHGVVNMLDGSVEGDDVGGSRYIGWMEEWCRCRGRCSCVGQNRNHSSLLSLSVVDAWRWSATTIQISPPLFVCPPPASVRCWLMG